MACNTGFVHFLVWTWERFFFLGGVGWGGKSMSLLWFGTILIATNIYTSFVVSRPKVKWWVITVPTIPMVLSRSLESYPWNLYRDHCLVICLTIAWVSPYMCFLQKTKWNQRPFVCSFSIFQSPPPPKETTHITYLTSSKKSRTGPTERTAKPEYPIALATHLGVCW